MSTGASGACQCGGMLFRTTYGKALAAAGRYVNPKLSAEALNSEWHQCSKCHTIYDVSHVTSAAESIDFSDADEKDYGVTNGQTK